MLFHDIKLFVTCRGLQQDYCNIERGVRLGMGLTGEYYFGRQMGRGITCF